MKVASRVAASLMILAWLGFMLAGFRSWTLQRDIQRMPMSVCQSRPADFQIADMKGQPACVAVNDARKWADSARFLRVGIFYSVGLFLIGAVYTALRKK